MSLELLDDLIDSLREHSKSEFPEILDNLLSYGFIEDTDLAELLEIDFDDLDILMTDTSDLKITVWTTYRKKLIRHLKNEKKQYEHLYYSDE